jgi:ABC-type lipoprotein export system ATPase subunit
MPSFDFPENNIDNPDDQYEEYKKKFNTIKNCIDLVLQYKWQILLDTKFKKNQTTHTMTLESMSIMERITDMLKININKIENNSAISNIESLIESIKNNKNEKEYFSIFYLYFLPFFCNTRYAIGFKHEKNISFVSILNIAYNHTQYRCMFFSNLLIDLFASYITGLIIVGIIYISIFNPQMILKYDKNILENDGIINFENELQSLNSIFFFTSFEFLFAIFFVFIFSRILFGSSLVYQLGFIGNNLYRNNLFGIDNMILHYTEVFKKSVNIKEGISSFKMPFALANFINILMEKSSASSSEHHQLIINMKEGFLDKAITPTNKINPESIKEILITTAKIYDILKYNYMIEDFLYKLFAKYNENKKSKISITDLPKVDTSDISNLLKEIGRTITSISLLDSISSMNGSSPINAIKTILEHNSKNNKEINFVIPLLVEGPIQYQIKFIQNLTASVLFFLLAYSSNKFIDFFRYYCNFIFNLQDFINSIFLYKYSLRKILPVEVFSNGTFNIIPLGVACKYFNFYYEINKVPNDDEPVKREQVQIFKDLNFNVIPLNIQPYVLRYLNNTLIMNKVEYNCGWSNVTAVLSGKSGSGKSTLFDIMAMFFKNWNNGYLAFIGTDEYGKLNIINASLLDKRSLRKNIIYISQNLGALRAGYKVYELIDLFGSGGNKEILFYILDYFGIKIDLEQDVANLSGGEFKILCIGLAFLNNCNRLFYENGKIRFSSEIQLILNDEVDKGMDPARRSLFNVLMINASSMLIKYNRKYATNMASIHFNDIYSRSTNNLDFKRTGLLHIKEIQAPYRNATCLSISHFGDEQNILFRYNIDKVFKILKVYLARSSNLIKNFTDNSDLMKD